MGLEVRISSCIFLYVALIDRCGLASAEASNCGGVAVSGLEMAQNSARLTWASEEVDARLKSIMENAYKACYDTGVEYGEGGENTLPSLVAGANISGFIKVRWSSFLLGMNVWYLLVIPCLFR